ncbi:hypothetical protein [Alistipes putredinis]|uniref:hypothetical protein n=1 Tax=Alistipes putredinis TaxID=28117 RepID=UPI003993E6F4
MLTLGKTYYQGDKSVAVSEPGKPIGCFHRGVPRGRGHLTVNKADIASSPENTLAAVAPGDLKFRDVTGRRQDHRSRPYDDRQSYAPISPTVTRSTCNTGSFDLGIDFQGVYGNELFSASFPSAYAQYNYHTKRLGRLEPRGHVELGADSRFVARHADDEFELLHRGRQ